MRPERIEDIIRAKLASSVDGRVHYTELARALRISPGYADQILRQYCPGDFDRGYCYAPPEKEEEVKA